MIHDMIEHASYMAHGYCLLWKPWLVVLHAGADFLIFAAYFAIPVAIWRFLKGRPDLELRRLAVLFAAFIALCGLTHLLQFVTLWLPIYEIQGVVKLLTAVVSLATAVVIFPLVPKALALPSPGQLKLANDGLEREIALHRQTLRELEQARDELEHRVEARTRELASSNARFEALVQASAQVVWTRGPDGKLREPSPSWGAFTGQSDSEQMSMGWLEAIHPGDRDKVLAAWRKALANPGVYSLEYRLRDASGRWRWTAAKGVALYAENGEVREWVGMNTDITERKEAEQSQLLLMAEVNHRAKNLLSVVQAVARQTAGEENPKLYAERLSERISSLAASHDLLVANRWRGVAVGELAASQLAHFKDLIGSRITLQGADVLLKPAASQALGMALHELATNAAKYGALRDGEGRVGISWAVSGRGDDARFSFEWKEHMGAPPGPPARKGFGHRVLSDMVRHALDANVCLEYPDTGFVWRFDAPADRALEPEDNAPIQSEQEPGKIASSNC